MYASRSGFTKYLTPRSGLEFLLIVVVILAIQNSHGAYQRDFASGSDEPAHFVTGVMVHDYVTRSLGTPPLPFAEEYYLRYPKVAIGHWPPGFYALQAIWYALVGVSKSSATLLVGLILGGTAWCLYRRLSKYQGAAVAAVTLAVFLGQPLVQSHSILIMSDMLACLGVLLAVFAFNDFLATSSLKSAAAFVLWSSLAILTRPSCLALAIFVPIGLLLTGHWRVFTNWRLWGAGALVGLLTALYYIRTFSRGMGLHSHGNLGRLIEESVRFDRAYHGSDTWHDIASVWLFAVVTIGLLSWLWVSWRNASQSDARRIEGGTAIALCAATFIFLYAAPMYSSPRYFLPFLIGAMILYARGIETLLFAIPGPMLLRWGVVCSLGLAAVVTAPGQVTKPINGYAAVADGLGDPLAGRVMLISSNSMGEGGFIVERLLRDRSRSEYVLRSSKVLGTAAWLGSHYSSHFSTIDQLADYLDSVPVHFVVVDDFVFRAGETPPYHDLLKELLRETPEQFRLVQSYNVSCEGKQYPAAMRVYENRAARGRYQPTFELDLGDKLGRTLSINTE